MAFADAWNFSEHNTRSLVLIVSSLVASAVHHGGHGVTITVDLEVRGTSIVGAVADGAPWRDVSAQEVDDLRVASSLADEFAFDHSTTTPRMIFELRQPWSDR